MFFAMPLALHMSIFKKKSARIFLEEIVKLSIEVICYNRKFDNFLKEYPGICSAKGIAKNIPNSEVFHYAQAPPTTLSIKVVIVILTIAMTHMYIHNTKCNVFTLFTMIFYTDPMYTILASSFFSFLPLGVTAVLNTV